MLTTYSILGIDKETNSIGIAVQSKFPNVGSIVPHGKVDIGVIATQAFANSVHAKDGISLLSEGRSPKEVIDILIKNDEKRNQRQIGILNMQGDKFSYTGEDVYSWDGYAGSAEKENCIAQGNSLKNKNVLNRMVSEFEKKEGSLSEKLLHALDAGQQAGGEIRGQQSAAILVLKKGAGYDEGDDRLVDISIFDHKEPIKELARCYELYKLSFFPSNPKNLIQITDDIAILLKKQMKKINLYDGEENGHWDKEEIEAMKRFMGWENYDNRMRDDNLIDIEILNDIKNKLK